MKKSVCSLTGIILLVSCGGRQLLVDKVYENGVEVVLNHLEPYKIRTADEFFAVALRLFLPFLDQQLNPRLKKIRLVGLRMEKLITPDAGG